MSHPALVLTAAAAFAQVMRGKLVDIPMRRVLVNNGLADPRDAFGHGGMTRVPFLTFMLSGRARVVVRDGGQERAEVMQAGDAVVHAPESYARAIHERPGASLRLTCDTDHLLCGLSLCRDPADLDSGRGFPPMQGCIHPQPLAEPGAGLLRLLIASAPQAQEQRRAWLAALLWQVHDLLAAEGPRRGDATWMAMRAWLDERAHLPIGRDDCACAFGVHPNHVARLFRRHGGSSFTACLLQLRLERAQILLRDATRPVAAIARDCGFADAAYFVRRFRERYGRPPGRWRQVAQG